MTRYLLQTSWSWFISAGPRPAAGAALAPPSGERAPATSRPPAAAWVPADPPARPTIWGLSPTNLHDRFWAARGVQVVRQGEPSEIVADAELYMLADPRTLTIFKLRTLVDQISWLRPDVLFVRLHEAREHGYRERVVAGAGDRFVRFERIYGASDTRIARIALTNDRHIAQVWQAAPDPRSGWRRLRRMIPRRYRATASRRAMVFDRTVDHEVMQFVRDLVRVWRQPDATIARARRGPGRCWRDPDAAMPGSAKVIGPVWVGAGRELEAGASVIGPAVLWDRPDARPRVDDLHWLEIEPTETFNRPVVQRRRGSIDRAFKRAFDVVFSLLVLLLTLPIYPLVMLAIWLEDGRPFFFGHMRETTGGREFPCLKFRSMRKDADRITAQLAQQNRADGPQFFLDPDHDPRLTRVGRIIRWLNIDELPQFLNVLAGHMSVVGPRPSPFKENQFCPAWREARLSVRPGITGLWQVRRSRRQGLDFQEWIKYDLEYVQRGNTLLDLSIVLQTIRVVLRGIIHS